MRPLVSNIADNPIEGLLTKRQHAIFALPTGPPVVRPRCVLPDFAATKALDRLDDVSNRMAWRNRKCDVNVVFDHAHRVHPYAMLKRE